MLYVLSSSKCILFHNSIVFGPCIIYILDTGLAKIKKNNSGAKRLSLDKPFPGAGATYDLGVCGR